MRPALTITAVWRSFLDGEDGYVIEAFERSWTPAGGYKTFGPMPRDTIGPFIDERRELLQDTARSIGAELKHRQVF